MSNLICISKWCILKYCLLLIPIGLAIFMGLEMSEKKDSDVSKTSIYDFEVKDIKGEPVSFSRYKDHVLLIVNVASKCGLTATNYKELNELHDQYESEGLKILAFPCNQFSGQEPGDSEQICQFAKSVNVKFELFEKVDVNGSDAHPLWAYLQKAQTGSFGLKSIKWNFTKFIVNKKGQVVERHGPTTNPSSLKASIEKYLKE